VAYHAFFHFCAPQRFVLIGLEVPFLQNLYDGLTAGFPIISGTIGPLLAVALFLTVYDGKSPWVRWLPIAVAAAQIVVALTVARPLTLAAIQRTLLVDYGLLVAAFLYLFPGIRRAERFEFSPRPVALLFFATMFLAAVFYCARELMVEDWWGDFSGRLAFFLLFGVLLLLARGHVLDPLLTRTSHRVSSGLKLLLAWLLTDLFLARWLSLLLAHHLHAIFPFIAGTDVHHRVFFDKFAIWLAFALVTYDIVVVRATGGYIRAFERTFSPADGGGVFPLRIADHFFRRRCPPRARFLLAWGLVYVTPLAALAAVFHGGYFFFLLGPVVPALCVYLCLVFLSQGTVVWGTGVGQTRPGVRQRAVCRVVFLLLLVLLVGTVPAFVSSQRWRELFSEYAPLEKATQYSLDPFAASGDKRYVELLEDAKRFDHTYDLEQAVAADFAGFNVVLLSSDAVRAQSLGCYGYPRDTSPNLDRLAEVSTVFTRAYAPANHTFTSIRSFLRADLTDQPMQTFGGTWLEGLLQEGVFANALIYNTDFLHLPRSSSIEGLQLTRQFDLENRAQLRADLATVEGGPFFLWAHNTGTHMRYTFKPSSTSFGAGQIDLYDNNIHYFDAFVGFVLDLLQERRLAKKTIVIVTSDHGEHFNEHGIWGHVCTTFYEEVIRIPLIVYLPGRPHRVADGYTSLTDLGPTISELFGYRTKHLPSWVMSQRDVLLGHETTPRERVLPLTSIYHLSVGVLRSDGLKFFITPDAEVLLDSSLDPQERRNLLREKPARADEGRRLCHEFFGLGGR
jgi:hypothetical protein